MKKLLSNRNFILGLMVGMAIGLASAWLEVEYNKTRTEVSIPQDQVTITTMAADEDLMASKAKLEKIVDEMIKNQEATGQDQEIVVGDYLTNR